MNNYDTRLVHIIVNIGDEDLEKLTVCWTKLGFVIQLIKSNDDGTTTVSGNLNDMTLRAVVAHPLVTQCIDPHEGVQQDA